MDIQLSCHYIVLLIKLFRDRHNHLEVPLSLTCSDACEIFFSKVGGMIQNERNYDGCDLVESAGAIARIAEFEANPEGPQFARAHKKQIHIWTKLEKNSILPLANLGDYAGLESDDQIVSTLKLGFIEAQMLCAELGMKPAKVPMNSWWEQPWVHERKLEKELFNSMEEEECDVDHIQDATGEEGDICGKGQAVTNASSSSTKAERCGVSKLMNDEVEVAGLQSELRHVLDDVLDEHESCQVVSKSVLPYVEFERAKIYKSTLVSQLNGNPTLSKDRLTRIKSGIIYTEEKVKTLANHDTLLKLGCDCAVVFLNTPEAQTMKK